MKASKAQKVVEAVRADVAKRGLGPDTTAQRPSASSGALPRVEYFDGSAALCVSDGEGPGRCLALAEGATDAEMCAIVCRCNAHDKLVSALRAIISRTNCTSHEMGTDIAAIASDAFGGLGAEVEGK